jgi:hypothetical protein
MSLMAFNHEDNPEFAELLAELTWTGNHYVGTQRAIERITGLAKSTIRQGLGCDPGRAAEDPKMLKWLAAQRIKAGGIQREWQAGAIKDGNIALLIRYAANESQTKPAEAQRWQRLIESVGFRQVIHELSGRQDLLARVNARGKGLPAQRAFVDTLQQQGKNIGRYRADLAKFLTGGFQPKTLEKMLREVFPSIAESTCWRSHADARTLLLMQSAESLAAVTGDSGAGRLIRTAAVQGGWSGEVEWQEEKVDPNQCDKALRRLRASNANS